VNQLRQLMIEELRRRNFADTTIRTYLHGDEHFSRYFRRRPEHHSDPARPSRPRSNDHLSASFPTAPERDRQPARCAHVFFTGRTEAELNSRPLLEMADIVRCAGQPFVEHSRRWINWQHRKVLLAIARCRTAALGGHRDRCIGCGHNDHHLIQLVSKPTLPKMPGQRASTLAQGARAGTAAHSLRPCGVHSAAGTGPACTAEQAAHL